ncbi:hypothetical protein [Actinoplanes sp. NPDC051411]|uniref:hypothetical protein n=1 Tax=Actinoplanes sp. NPDC051411 TaxID=3155522 RepID=UPI00341BDE8B
MASRTTARTGRGRSGKVSAPQAAVGNIDGSTPAAAAEAEPAAPAAARPGRFEVLTEDRLGRHQVHRLGAVDEAAAHASVTAGLPHGSTVLEAARAGAGIGVQH